ncbi:MAG: hypothetical protein JWO67_2471 [Streptosporangiaceae bacterium]|nr:hypothetical protein [Streptosporangiaceae bacterium]
MTGGAETSPPPRRTRRRLVLTIALVLAVVAVIEPAALQRYQAPTGSNYIDLPE